MKLEHLINAYKLNKITANLKKNIGSERAGVIEFEKGITASYLLDDEEIVVSMNIFFNCITRKGLTMNNQITHVLKVVNVMQQTIMFIANVPQKECNMILTKLGLFDSSFKKRKANKTFGMCF